MSNNNSTEMIAWAREVCALRADLSRPIETVSDPRMLALVRAMKDHRGEWEAVNFAPEELGELYFSKVGVDLLPAPPLEVPSWGVERQLSATPGQRLEVWDYGAQWDSGETSARLERLTLVVLDAAPDRDELPGDVDVCEPELSVWTGLSGINGGFNTFDLRVDRAAELECVLGDVLHALRETV